MNYLPKFLFTTQSEGIPSIDSKEFESIGSYQGDIGGPSVPGAGGGIGFENLNNHGGPRGGPRGGGSGGGGMGDPLSNIPNVPNAPGNLPYPPTSSYPGYRSQAPYPSNQVFLYDEPTILSNTTFPL